MKYKIIVGFLLTLVMLGITLPLLMGNGGWKRKVTLSGVYSVCKPDNYDVVCFLDADSKDGGLSCLPLSQIKRDNTTCN